MQNPQKLILFICILILSYFQFDGKKTLAEWGKIEEINCY